MRILWAILGVILILIILLDAFEAVVLPRRVTRRFRLTRLFYRNTWRLWLSASRLTSKGRRHETYLSYFGPLSLILLLSVWAFGLILGFALLNWGAGSEIRIPEGPIGLEAYLYLSGTTFFTLGLGDVIPLSTLARTLTVIEAGVGFGFLALVIGYLPGMNQSFSRREVNISLLDAHAGSPPAASEMLRRGCPSNDGLAALIQQLADWERWSAELLESHLSYPVLAYFRSQHDNQSWLAVLTTILDTSAFVMTAMEGVFAHHARSTFAIARHAIVDLSLVFNRPPLEAKRDRLPGEKMAELWAVLTAGGLKLREGDDVEKQLTELRRTYEPYLNALSLYFRMTIPPWISESGRRDNWQTSAWGRRRGLRRARTGEEDEEHF